MNGEPLGAEAEEHGARGFGSDDEVNRAAQPTSRLLKTPSCGDGKAGAWSSGKIVGEGCEAGNLVKDGTEKAVA